MRNSTAFILLFALAAGLWAGPYNDPGIFPYVGDDGSFSHPVLDPNSHLNPIFRGWATGWLNYAPAAGPTGEWTMPAKALGPALCDTGDVVSLGDLDSAAIAAGALPGRITLTFTDPDDADFAIRNGKGYDFAVFENGFISTISSEPNGTAAGQFFTELAYVEVSTDGLQFARFPSVSLTPNTGEYLTHDITNIYNLAGKHPNTIFGSMGTAFDLDSLRAHPLVLSGEVDLQRIHYVRIVDIPGSGDFFDEAAACAFPDPATGPDWQPYPQNHPIRDAWPTQGPAGFDLEAIGVLKEQQYAADINLDGIVDLKDFIILSRSWRTRFGQPGYCLRCDLSDPGDLQVDLDDLIVFSEEWMQKESWHQGGRR